jgi:tRNA (guanine37-N1)-methyltransferase
MVIQAEPVAQAIDSIPAPGRRILLSPNGVPFSQPIARRLSTESDITFVCGRYEGIDARLHIDYVDEVISVGDYVLSGGELAAMIIADAVTRLLPSVLNNAQSAITESHSEETGALLEHPHYTRPAVWRDHSVPEVLLSGHHEKIERWRRAESLKLTAQVRPELLQRLITSKILNPKEQAEAKRLLS